MADNYLERHQEEYEQRKSAWLNKHKSGGKPHRPKPVKPDDEAL